MAVGRSPCSPPPSPFLPIGLCINRLSRHFCAAPLTLIPFNIKMAVSPSGCVEHAPRKLCLRTFAADNPS